MPTDQDVQPARHAVDPSASRAKVAAALVLAALGIGGMTWSILRTTQPASPRAPRQSLTPPAAVPPAPEGGFVISGDGTILSYTPATPENQDSNDAPPGYGPPQPGETPDAPASPAPTPGAGPASEPPTAVSPGSPHGTPPADSGSSAPESLAPGQTINVNAATEAQLQLLPGIGPSRARAIIQDRTARGPFRSVSDLDRVRGIGPGIIDGLRRFARVN